MKSDHDNLPVFESLDRDAPPAVEATDFASLAAPSPMVQQPRRKPVATSFADVRDALDDLPHYHEHRTLSDYLIESVTPLLIFLMIAPVIFYLIDTRWLFTRAEDFASMNDQSLRMAAFGFVMGVVALNRLVARDGKDESILYIVSMAVVTGLFTMCLQVFSVGSFTGGFLSGPWEVVFNMILVCFIWWLVNRLTHECSIDSHPAAGDVGILTGTARKIRKTLSSEKPAKALPDRYITGQFDVYEGFDPSTWKKPEPKRKVIGLPSNAERLSKRHPGMSILYFSIPVMILFTYSHRMILLHNQGDLRTPAHLYVGLYVFSTLMLLMLTSLTQLRFFFRNRLTPLPNGLATFWVGTGFFMTVAVMTAALALPYPGSPGTDILSAEEGILVDKVGKGVFIVLALFVAYALLRAFGAYAAYIAQQRHKYPTWVIRLFNWIDRILDRLSRLPRLPRWHPPRRISPEVSTARRYVNPLRNPAVSAQLGVTGQIEYAYAALCALALDLGVPRRQDQTPYEFLSTFPRELRSIRSEAEELIQLYVEAAYGARAFGKDKEDRLRRFWLTYDKIRDRVIR